MKYYLYYLKQRGVEGITGKLDYPLLKESVEVTLTQEDEVEIERILSEIRKVTAEDKPPVYESKRICRSCAYFDLCVI